jgi:hypothetical protein
LSRKARLADFRKHQAKARAKAVNRGGCAIALCAARRYMHPSIQRSAPLSQQRRTMRAEIERLVEEIKQSVGLLRRHL